MIRVGNNIITVKEAMEIRQYCKILDELLDYYNDNTGSDNVIILNNKTYNAIIRSVREGKINEILKD